MSMMRRDPFDALLPLREAMNRLFEESVVGPRFEFFMGRSFPLDVYETQDKQQYIVEAALPGFTPEDIHITAEGETLSIRAAKAEASKVEKDAYMRRERYEGEMMRTVTLPGLIEANKVEATYEQGVLKVAIPKSQATGARQIPVQVKEPAGTR